MRKDSFSFVICIVSVIILAIILVVILKPKEDLIKPMHNLYESKNNTNNTANLGKLAILNKNNYYFYCDNCDPSGLYFKAENEKMRFIESGDIFNIIVYNDWVYYIKLEYISDFLGYYSLYRMDLNGSNKVKLLDHVCDVNIYNDKIYFRVSYFSLGGNSEDVLNEVYQKNGYVYKSDLDGKNIELLVEEKTSVISSMLVDDDFIYYVINNELFRYHISDDSIENLFAFENNSTQYLISKNLILFKESDSFVVYNLNSKSKTKILENLGYINFFAFDDMTLYFLEPNKNLTVYHLDSSDSKTIKYTGRQNYIYLFDNIPYLVAGNEIVNIDNVIN